jgi:hypothetical protein
MLCGDRRLGKVYGYGYVQKVGVGTWFIYRYEEVYVRRS